MKLISQELKSSQRPLILANGCFDILHVDHLKYLQQSKQCATNGKLLVLLNSDESVRQLKGNTRPIQPLDHRLLIIAALEFVDYVMPFNELRITKYLRELSPSHWTKGPDYTLEKIDKDELAAANENHVHIHFTSNVNSVGVTTTELIEKVISSKRN